MICRVFDVVFLTTGGPVQVVSSRTFGQASRVSFLHQNRKKGWSLYEHICLQTNSFRHTALTFTLPKFSRFLTVGTRKHHSVSICNWKWTDTSPKHFNICQTIRSDQMCPCVHWTRWMIFSACVVNCDLINDKNLKLLNWERVL